MRSQSHGLCELVKQDLRSIWSTNTMDDCSLFVARPRLPLDASGSAVQSLVSRKVADAIAKKERWRIIYSVIGFNFCSQHTYIHTYICIIHTYIHMYHTYILTYVSYIHKYIHMYHTYQTYPLQLFIHPKAVIPQHFASSKSNNPATL